METWTVEEIYFERESIEQTIETRSVPCARVVYAPSASHGEDTAGPGGLRLQGCPHDAMAALPWPPTRIRFKAHKLFEERLFEIGPLVREGDEWVAQLPATGHDVDTQSSDGHIGAFPATDVPPRF